MEALKYAVLCVLVWLGLSAGFLGLGFALVTGDWRPLLGCVVAWITWKSLTS
jgi:hypothetical protein